MRRYVEPVVIKVKSRKKDYVLTEMDKTDIHNLYTISGYGASKISILLNVPQSQVERYLKENNLFRSRLEGIKSSARAHGGSFGK